MNTEEDRAVQLADVALEARRLTRAADRVYLGLTAAERRVLRIRCAGEPDRLARFDALEREESGEL